MELAPGARTTTVPTHHLEDPVNRNYTPGTIAARAINAHPWLSAVYPELEDADLLISPPYPSQVHDEPSGHIEGCATWNTTGDGTVNYHIALAYEGPDGTVEDEVTAEISPGPLAWLDLARSVAELMDRLHTEACLGAFA
jgi:hypothetical protein